jgi:hypothetical protein
MFYGLIRPGGLIVLIVEEIAEISGTIHAKNRMERADGKGIFPAAACLEDGSSHEANRRD